jgi:ribosomal protein S18 acetylase RimI-like enzyme
MSLWCDYLKEREGFESVETQYGFATFKITDGEMYIRDLYVLPDFRRLGKATEVADLLTDIAYERRCKILSGTVSLGLPSTTDSVKALLFYGFTVHGFNPQTGQLVFIKHLLDKVFPIKKGE